MKLSEFRATIHAYRLYFICERKLRTYARKNYATVEINPEGCRIIQTRNFKNHPKVYSVDGSNNQEFLLLLSIKSQ